MTIRRLLVAVTLGTLLSASSAAAEPSFSFLDLGLIKAGHGGSGGGIRGSAALGDRGVVHGSLDAYSYYNGSLVDATLGGGMRWSVAPAVSATAGLSAEIFGGSYDDDNDNGVEGLALGIGAGAGLRGRTDRIELEAGLKYVTVVSENAPGKLLASAAARYDLTPRMAAGLTLGNDYFGFRAGVSIRFDLRHR